MFHIFLLLSPADASLFFLVDALEVRFPPLVSNFDVLWSYAKPLCICKNGPSKWRAQHALTTILDSSWDNLSPLCTALPQREGITVVQCAVLAVENCHISWLFPSISLLKLTFLQQIPIWGWDQVPKDWLPTNNSTLYQQVRPTALAECIPLVL